jgi:phosphohistidine swiveling domain-containing protein
VTSTDEIVFPGPGEIEGFWAFDKMHAPRPLHPLSQDLVMTTLSEGFTAAQTEYDCPIMASSKAVNNYFYMAFHPVPDEAVIADRMTRYHGTLASKVPGIGERWNNEWKPQIVARNYAEKEVDYSGMSDDELLAKLDDMTDWMRQMWYVHGHINFVLLSGAAFCDMYDAEMQPSDPTEAYQVLQGHHTRSVDASRGIWALSRQAKHSSELKALFDNYEPRELVAKLGESEAGRAFLADLDEFLHEYGWRSDAVYDLADKPWREDPAIPLGNIAMFIGLPDSEDPEVLYQRGVKLREQLYDAARAKLSSDPAKLAHFDELYAAAQYSYPITEDHAFYIDQLGVVLLRRFTLAVGERLAAKGSIDDREDVYFLYANEVRETLAGGGDRRAVVAERRANLDACAQVTPPGALGEMPPAPPGPPDPFMDALVTRLLGVKPPPEFVDPVVIDAVSGSPGVYTGVARVVKSLNEAGDLEEGEIMVCEMTLPPWVPMFSIAGAVVSDVGGVMSHCAIVAREFAIPAVVGSVDGTTRITSGQTITVDGTSGKVYLDGRSL